MCSILMGIDFGVASTGVAIDATRDAFLIKTSSKEELSDRIIYILGEIDSLLEAYGITHVCMEKPYMSYAARRHMDKTFTVFGAIYGMLLYQKGLKVILIPPGEWMRVLKPDEGTLIKNLRARGWWALDNDHVRDAAGLLEYYKEAYVKV